MVAHKVKFLVGSLILVLLTGSGIIAIKAAGQGFIENKGQWPQQVLFATEIPGGTLYIEKSRLLYYFYAINQHSHAQHAGSDHASTDKDASSYQQDSQWRHAFEVVFSDAAPTWNATGVGARQTAYSYLYGSDPEMWTSGVRSFDTVTVKNIYHNVDFSIYMSGNQIKYDLVVHPGGSPKSIAMQYQGLEDIIISEGNLHLITRLTELTEMKPFTYQVIGNKMQEIPCEFIQKGNKISFSISSKYDHSRKLIIDPLIIFSVYSGSSADNWGNTATYDNRGNLYSGGIVSRAGYPVSLGAYQVSYAGGSWDVAIMKFDSAGTRLVYATYLGGNSTETPQSLVTNEAGELFILGTTSSRNFPVTNGSTFKGGVNFEPMEGAPYANGSDLFVAKLSANGTELAGCTYLGGSKNDGVNFVSGTFNTRGMVQSPLCKNYGDQFRGDIIIDHENNILIASNTSSSDFPCNNGGSNYLGGSHDALVVKLSSDFSILWSRFLGGSNTDAAYSIKLSNQNEVIVAGGTISDDFVGMNGLHTINQGGIDGWVARLSEDGVRTINGTYVGTSSYDQAYFIDINAQEEVYLYGQTQGSYPVAGNVFSQAAGGQFIHKLSRDLKTSHFSTVFGSGNNQPNISPTAFLVSNCSKLYMAGWGGRLNATTVTSGFGPFAETITRNFVGGSTTGMLVSPDAYQSRTEGDDFYLMVLDEDASAFVYGTFLGGSQSVTHVDGGTSRFDKRGIVYHAVCAGCGGYSDFPAVNAPSGHNMNRATNASRCNNAAFKFDLAVLSAALQTNSVAFDSPGLDTLCFPSPLILQNLSSGAKYYEWNLGDGTILTKSDTSSIRHSYAQPGIYTVTLTAFNNETCEGIDAATAKISIFDPEVDVVDDATICQGSNYTLTASGGVSYYWESDDGTFTSTLQSPIVSPMDTTRYYVEVKDKSGCGEADTVLIQVLPQPEYKFKIKKEYDCWNRPLARFSYEEETGFEEYPYNFSWDLGDGSIVTGNDFEHRYSADSTYQVKLKASNEYCFYEQGMPLTIITIKVPNVITPNGDSRNDSLIVDAERVNLTVYNRWGTEIFREENYQDGWSATNLAPGVYYYKLDIAEEGSCKGWIQVLK